MPLPILTTWECPDQSAVPIHMASDAGTLMRDFIAAPDADSELLLTELLATHAGPHVRRIVTQRLSAAGVSEYQDIDDLCGDVLTELLYRLR
ncbi:MAG TPA: hypothetical protein VGK48_06115, partial [Terriglobia bacterium]